MFWGRGVNAAGLVADPHINREMWGPRSTAGEVSPVSLYSPTTALCLPGQHHPGRNGKAAASFTANDKTQIPLEPEAYVNVWF